MKLFLQVLVVSYSPFTSDDENYVADLSTIATPPRTRFRTLPVHTYVGLCVQKPVKLAAATGTKTPVPVSTPPSSGNFFLFL